MKINFFREIVANYIINDVINEKFAFQKNKNSDRSEEHTSELQSQR